MSGSPSLPPSASDPSPERAPAGQADPAALADFLPRPLPAGSLRERLASHVDRLPISPRRLALLAAGAGVALFVAMWLFRPPAPAVEATLPRAVRAADAQPVTPATTSPASTPTARPRSVVVDAAGAVKRPGLYRLAPGARVNDLIRAAGGLRPGADPDRLNLAALLADGQRLYVPKAGESTDPVPVDPTGGSVPGSDPAATAPTGSPGAGGSTAPRSPVDLNTASAEELDTLPGVGPSTAASIIAYRTQHGPFHSVDDLLDVRGIGDTKLAALRPRVRV